MNKRVSIITESKFDADVLNKILSGKDFDAEYRILSSSGYSSALSTARSLLTLRNQKVLLLLDTDTIESNGIREKKEFVNFYLNANINKDDFKAVWAIPEFEIIFLKNKKFLSELNAEPISRDLIEIGESSPRRALERITSKRRYELLPILDNKEVRDAFFEEGLVKEISDFIGAEVTLSS